MKKCIICKKEFDGNLSDVCSWQCDEEVSHFKLRQSKVYSRHVLRRQKPSSHLLLLYENERKRDDMVTEFIQDGLRRGHLCVYASVNLNTEFVLTLRSRILNFDDHISDGNLILTDLRSFQDPLLKNDLSLFEEFQAYLINKVKFNKEKFIRITGDLMDYLMEHAHYESGMLLESWWEKSQFYGTNLCTCCNTLLNTTETEEIKQRIFDSHDIVISC